MVEHSFTGDRLGAFAFSLPLAAQAVLDVA